ncbi:UNVERIFIED_CONTAM: hypothetical protein HHA_454800 [Hammondia hammondi]|eukprot:XP_008888406.1 hypothetical protein HHA_454800 [Hammondia hammondi]
MNTNSNCSDTAFMCSRRACLRKQRFFSSTILQQKHLRLDRATPTDATRADTVKNLWISESFRVTENGGYRRPEWQILLRARVRLCVD